MSTRSHAGCGIAMRTRNAWFATAVLVAVALLSGYASAQHEVPTHLSGTIDDYVWVEAMGPGFGAWHVSGEWSLQLNGTSGKAEFAASILGVRSDLWVLQNLFDPATVSRSPHTHHVLAGDGQVTSIPNGFRVSGTATITGNGSVTPYSNSPIEVDITGGNLIRFSNMKLTFFGDAVGHFGPQAYDGVVVLGR